MTEISASVVNTKTRSSLGGKGLSWRDAKMGNQSKNVAGTAEQRPRRSAAAGLFSMPGSACFLHNPSASTGPSHVNHSLRTSIAVMKNTMTKCNLGKKGFVSFYSPSSGEVREGTWRQQLTPGDAAPWLPPQGLLSLLSYII